MTEDAKPGAEKREEPKAVLTYGDLGREYEKAQAKLMYNLPLIGKPLMELDKALCDAGLSYRSVFPVDCAITNDVAAEMRKQATPSTKPDTARSGGIQP